MIQRHTRRGMAMLISGDLVDAALWREYLRNPAGHVRQQLFERYVSFARAIAREEFYRRPPANFELADAEQLAFEGLLEAIERFDPLREIPFQGFARPRIRGNISNGLSKASEANALYSFRYRAEKDRLKSLSAGLDEQQQDPIAALSKLAATLALGLLLERSDTGDVDKVPSAEPTAYDTLAWHELSAGLHEIIALLPDREAFIIQQHYRNGVSFQQIAILLGLSKGRISQLHAAAMERLRLQMAKYR